MDLMSAFLLMDKQVIHFLFLLLGSGKTYSMSGKNFERMDEHSGIM